MPQLTLAREEMKRADHLLYVSLKYTRTVDVIKNLIDRHISAIDAIIQGMLEEAEEKHKIMEIPDNKGLRADMVQEVYNDEFIKEMVEFYHWMKQVNRAEFDRAREFRRHVTMTAHLPTGPVEINIDVIKEHYIQTKGYLESAERLLYGEPED